MSENNLILRDFDESIILTFDLESHIFSSEDNTSLGTYQDGTVKNQYVFYFIFLLVPVFSCLWMFIHDLETGNNWDRSLELKYLMKTIILLDLSTPFWGNYVIPPILRLLQFGGMER